MTTHEQVFKEGYSEGCWGDDTVPVFSFKMPPQPEIAVNYEGAVVFLCQKILNE